MPERKRESLHDGILETKSSGESSLYSTSEPGLIHPATRFDQTVGTSASDGGESIRAVASHGLDLD